MWDTHSRRYLPREISLLTAHHRMMAYAFGFSSQSRLSRCGYRCRIRYKDRLSTLYYWARMVAYWSYYRMTARVSIHHTITIIKDLTFFAFLYNDRRFWSPSGDFKMLWRNIVFLYNRLVHFLFFLLCLLLFVNHFVNWNMLCGQLKKNLAPICGILWLLLWWWPYISRL